MDPGASYPRDQGQSATCRQSPDITESGPGKRPFHHTEDIYACQQVFPDMDREALEDEVDEWVREGIITDQQAAAILDRYDPAEAGRSRAVLALSLVGAALVFAGVTWFLATNWHDLPSTARALVLVAGPTLAYAAGIVAYDRDARRTGHALIVLGAILVGPSLFLFEDLLGASLPEAWLFLGWAAVALPTGHAMDSRPGTVLGLLVLVGAVVELVDPADPAPVVGLLGLVVFSIGYTRSTTATRTYRLAGAAITIGALLLLTTWEGRFNRFELEMSAGLLAGTVGAVTGATWLHRRGRGPQSRWVAAGIVAIAGATLTAGFAPETVPSLVGFLGTHAGALLAVAATGYLGFVTRSRALIDLSVIGALLQTLSFVAATVVDELSGAIALVVAGLVLLIIGVALERGRRSILQRFDADPDDTP